MFNPTNEIRANTAAFQFFSAKDGVFLSVAAFVMALAIMGMKLTALQNLIGTF